MENTNKTWVYRVLVKQVLMYGTVKYEERVTSIDWNLYLSSMIGFVKVESFSNNSLEITHYLAVPGHVCCKNQVDYAL